MTKPLLIVQSSPLKRAALDLVAAARARGHDVQDISFHREEEQAPALAGHHPVFIYGSVALRDAWAVRYPELRPWLWFDYDRFGPPVWVEAFGDLYLNAGGVAVSAADFVADSRFSGAARHVRPVRGDKKPVGGLYDQAGLAALALHADTHLWVAQPATITAEARIWFIGGSVAAGSLYRLDGAPAERSDPEATGGAVLAAAALGRIFLPHPHCVMDLARVSATTWKLLEFNPIHSAGWYAADPGVVLDAFVRHFAEPD
jgi:hypothetical protein